MAIQFARMEYVSRGEGKNACLKSAYNQRSKIKDESLGKTYSFASRGGNVFSEIMLPENASKKFKDAGVLWNEVERFERRKNSQLAKEIVLALPDNKEIEQEDRIELCRRFVSSHFTNNGLAVQIDIHAPHHQKDKNWHAHLLITTRRFREDGETFESHKARDLESSVRRGRVVEGVKWGRIWKEIQDDYFKEKGLSIRVDAIGSVPQEHLGPVRMRHHMSEVTARGKLLEAANTEASLDAESVLDTLTKTRSVFSVSQVDSYLNKHVREDLREDLKSEILSHSRLLTLHDEKTGEERGLYTTKDVRSEEESILRLSGRLNSEVTLGDVKKQFMLDLYDYSSEQKSAVAYCLEEGIRIIQGRAGTGKSYVMQGIKDTYLENDIPVIGLAPTNAVAKDLTLSGFMGAKTVHSFLFAYKNGRQPLKCGSVIMVDEAGMVGTTAFGELLKVAYSESCKVILVGDDRQLNSVERGGFFKVLDSTYGSVELSDVRRQTIGWQKQVSEDLSQGRTRSAVGVLAEQGAIHWSTGKEDSFSALIADYSRSYLEKPSKSRLILAHKNTEVDVMNQAIQRVRQASGQVKTQEYVCDTLRGAVPFAEGDRIQFMRTEKSLGLVNGEFGDLVRASSESFEIKKDDGDSISFNPQSYGGLRLGYAGTIYKGQGKTVEEAYVLHNPLMNKNLSYVALTRQIEVVRLYVSQEETKTKEALALQMERGEESLTSLSFMIAQQVAQAGSLQHSFLEKMALAVGDRVRHIVHHITDPLSKASFYDVSKPPSFASGKVIEQEATERWEKEHKEEPLSKSPDSPKDSTSPERESFKEEKKPLFYDMDQIEGGLKKDIKGFATHLLGDPDLLSSTRHELCFKKDGKVFVNLQTGLWKDFVNDTGGSIFTLIQRETGGSFKEALSYASRYLGFGESLKPLSIKKVEKEIEPKEIDLKTRERVEAVYSKSRSVESTTGEVYLRDHRGIKGSIPDDIRFGNLYNKEAQKEVPSLIAFMRDSDGKLSAYQTIYLDEKSGRKASLFLAKKTHGGLSGSFVEIQKEKGPVYIAEGLETALSLKEAGLEGTILASLGIYNMKNYTGSSKDIVLCADNDGINASTNKVVEKTEALLKEKGYKVDVVRPSKEGQDFNDVLVEHGKEAVQRIFRDKEASFKHVASKADFVHAQSSPEKISDQEAFGKTPASSLDSVQDIYSKRLTELYTKDRQEVPQKYKGEIEAIAGQAAIAAIASMVSGEIRARADDILLSKTHYEYYRLDELKRELCDGIDRVSMTWVGQHQKAEILTAVEGNLFKEIRTHQAKVSKEERLDIPSKALDLLKSHEEKVDIYKHEEMSKGISEERAQFFAEQRAYVEEKFKENLPKNYLEDLKKTSDHGYSKFKEYEAGYTAQMVGKGSEMDVHTKEYLRDISSYRADRESRENFVKICYLGGTSEAEKAISEKVVQKELSDIQKQYDAVREQQKQRDSEPSL